ncbi:MAG: class V aminotransferase [Hyphococcus sp.]|nr:MAG: class V aminotransferase [Marinicaulis sp.]
MNRDLFHLPQQHYFLSHSVGAQPQAYGEAVARGFSEPWRTEGFNVWGPWFGALEQFRNGLAPIIGAHGDDICPQPNVSSGLAKILFSLPERARRKKIVLTEDDFPTVGFALGQAQRAGYELVFLPGGERLADIDTWTPAFQDDVQLVLATHVYSNSSVMAPCAEIARRARERGVFCVLDIAQSAGAVPIHLNDWAPDFAVGTSLKYLCGGPGAAYLWAQKDTAARSAPMDVGWFSHAEPFEFDIHHFEYAPGAARYTGGTPSIAPFAGASAGHKILNTHGVDAIYAHNQKLLSRLFEQLPPDVFLSTTTEGARGSAAIIKVRDYDAAAATLADAGIAHDTRLGAVRLSIHLYNDEAGIDALVNALQDHL